MDINTVRFMLSQSSGEEGELLIAPEIFGELTLEDFPDGCQFQIGQNIDQYSVSLSWNGIMIREGESFTAIAEYIWSRKYWYAPLNLEHYMDLFRRSVEDRARTHGDVEVIDFFDDQAFIHFNFKIRTGISQPSEALEKALALTIDLEALSTTVANDIGAQVADIASRLSGLETDPIQNLIKKVDEAVTTDEKGRSLEELISRFFTGISGFTLSNRVRTQTEEIDISIINGSEDPRLKREAALILVECKNWAGRCGKNEFVIFRSKVENRNQRCTLGFLISWNGFAETITKEMLRGSREALIIIPVTGKDIREAVRSGDYLAALHSWWERDVFA
jgi:hypothetical protein